MPSSHDEEKPRKAVDLDVLREATMGDRDLMQELADLYVGDADLNLRALDDAVQNKEMERIRRIAGALRRASRNVGAGGASRIFEALEEAAREGQAEAVTGLVGDARAEFERVRRSLSDLR